MTAMPIVSAETGRTSASPIPTAHRTSDELDAALDDLRAAPRDAGVVELVVCRPAKGGRRVLEEGVLDLREGLLGDRWYQDPWKRLGDGSPDPVMQLTLVNARLVALVAGTPERRALAGDQLHVDLDLSEENLTVGSRLRVGTAVVEVTPAPHTGCKIFLRHYGPDATRFVNSREGRALRLRGINARVVEPGTVHPGDTVSKA